MTLVEIPASDRTDIAALVNAYAYAVDAREAATVSTLFTDDGVLMVPSAPERLTPTRELTGRAEIEAELAQLDAFVVTSHAITGHHLSAYDGDTARGVTRCEAHHVSRSRRDDSLRDLVWILRYADDYRRTAAGWRFERREITIDVVDRRTIHDATPREAARSRDTER